MESGIPFIDGYVIPKLVHIVMALLIFVIGKWVAERMSKWLLKVLLRSNSDDTLVKFIGHLFYGFLLAAVVLASLQELGFDVSSLLALVGAAGLAVGLALKDSLSNFAAGVMIIVFRPFKSGDTITATGQSGTVDEIGTFSTTLNTPDNQRIIIPNSSIIGSTIINSTSLSTRRIDLALYLSGSDNLLTAKAAIERVLAAETRLLRDPAPALGVEKIGTTHIELFVRVWVHTSDYALVKADLLEHIKLTLDAVGIVIPAKLPAAYLS